MSTDGLTPLHTRMLSLRFTWGGPGRLRAVGRVFDLRKRGLVPLAGKLQGPGVVHDMAVQMEIDYPHLRIRRIEPSMSAFPFAPGPATRGESCPDRLGNAQGLIGASLRDGYGAALTDEVGGPRGCFHIFTLLRLLGPTLEWALERARPAAGARRQEAAGSPLFARSVIIDGFKGDGLALRLLGALFDVHYPPAADTLPLQEELEAACEAAADFEVALPSMAITAAAGRMRRSGPGVDRRGIWEPVGPTGTLVGGAMQKGYTARVQERFAGASGSEPLQHLLFMLAPAMIQCVPSLVEEMELRPRRAESAHAAVDSCHMWRAGGPLVTMPPWEPQGGVL